MSRLTPTVVLLDAGNTLLELDYALIAERLSAHDCPTDATAVRDAEQGARPRLDAYLASGVSTEAPQSFQRHLGELLDDLGFGGDRHALIEDLRSQTRLWSPPIAGAAQAMEQLAERGHRLGVISNADGHARRRLADAGLMAHIEVVIDSARVGCEKPDPRIFALGLEALGVRADQAIYVGDLPAIDGRGARAAGLDFVLIDPAGVFDHRPSIRSVAELPEFLAGLST